MSVLIIVNTAPYGSEGPYNAFRLADALALRGEHVELFLMGDAVHAARAGDDVFRRDRIALLRHGRGRAAAVDIGLRDLPHLGL